MMALATDVRPLYSHVATSHLIYPCCSPNHRAAYELYVSKDLKYVLQFRGLSVLIHLQYKQRWKLSTTEGGYPEYMVTAF